MSTSMTARSSLPPPRPTIVLVLLVVLHPFLTGGCFTGRQRDKVPDEVFYEEAVSGLTGHSTSSAVDPGRLDYERLRRGRHLSLTPAQSEQLRALGQMIGVARARGDSSAGLRACHLLLERDYTDVGAHLEKARLLHGRDNNAAAFHERLALGLIRSMAEGAELDDPDRPFRVHSAREQQSLLEFLDVTPVSAAWVGEERVSSHTVWPVRVHDRQRRLRVAYFQQQLTNVSRR